MELIKEIVDIAIVAILGCMGFLAMLFTIERMLFLRKARKQLHRFSSATLLEQACTNNLTTLHIIYSNAPYIGLLGTVVGIMITFYDMGQASSIDTAHIMTGLSLALYATALGLVVAIPTLIAYNGLNRKVAVICAMFSELQDQQQAEQAEQAEQAPAVLHDAPAATAEPAANEVAAA